MVEQLLDPAVTSHKSAYMWIPKIGPPEARYAEIDTGSWWAGVHKRARASEKGFYIVPVQWFADSAAANARGSVSLKPVVQMILHFV